VILKKSLARNFLELGRQFKEIKDHKHYKTLGYESFNQYLATPEVTFHSSTAYRLIQIYEKFVIEFGVPEDKLIQVDRKKLEMLIPFVDKNNYEEWFYKAKELTRYDLDKEIKQLDELHCTHSWFKDEIWTCTKCHTRSRYKPNGTFKGNQTNDAP